MTVTSPPKSPLAFRIGVVGHRPHRLKEADHEKLTSVINDILKTVKEEVVGTGLTHQNIFSDATPVLRAISSLAEGTDRLFAEQALGYGYSLCCVMPFHQKEYENDFSGADALENDSLSRFHRILKKCDTIFELDGVTADKPSSYGVAGKVVLNQSDLLIVVWDGKKCGKKGGTEETLELACRMGIQILWIDAYAPHNWQFIDDESFLLNAKLNTRLVPSSIHTMEDIRKRVHSLLILPEIPAQNHNITHNDDKAEENVLSFYGERRPMWRCSAFIWKIFHDLLGKHTLIRRSLIEPDFEKSVAHDWPFDTSTPIAKIVDALRPYYAWADKLAVIYSDRYRSAFVMIFLLAAFSVGVGLIHVEVHNAVFFWNESLSILTEFLSIFIIILLFFLGKDNRWHGRWLDYRMAAELIRHLRLVAPLGGERPFPQVPAQWSTFGQIGSSWMAWYVRGVERAVSLPSVIINKEYLETSVLHLHEFLTDQANWHHRNYLQSKKIEEKLHYGGIALLTVTLIACGVHLITTTASDASGSHILPPGLFVFICSFCPALGASLAGINNQGEFRRIAKRSEAMEMQLRRLVKQTEELQEKIHSENEPADKQQSREVTALVSDVARLLVNEVLDWRVVLLDQPLKPS